MTYVKYGLSLSKLLGRFIHSDDRTITSYGLTGKIKRGIASEVSGDCRNECQHI
jgi:hypothetical protein